MGWCGQASLAVCTLGHGGGAGWAVQHDGHARRQRRCQFDLDQVPSERRAGKRANRDVIGSEVRAPLTAVQLF